MKRLFMLLAALMLMASASFAQKNFHFWSGNSYMETISDVDSLTFSEGNDLLHPVFVDLNATTNTVQGTVKIVLKDGVKSIDNSCEIGIFFSDENSTPTYEDYFKLLGNNVQDYPFTIKNLVPGTTYYYIAYVKIERMVYYSEVKSVTTKGEKPTPPAYTLINGHKFVDLGLPSGLLWAETNVGASSATDAGDYFAWGETEPKTNYSWDTYKWGVTPTKYNDTDGKTVLDAEDDVATVKWGAPCRMPSYSELEELYDNCHMLSKSDYNGVSGHLFTGPNGNTIFLPASGGIDNETYYNRGEYGYYWSRSIPIDGVQEPVAIEFLNFYPYLYARSLYRYYGLSVRPVTEK